MIERILKAIGIVGDDPSRQWTPLNSWLASTLSAWASFTTFSIPRFRLPRSIPLMYVV